MKHRPELNGFSVDPSKLSPVLKAPTPRWARPDNTLTEHLIAHGKIILTSIEIVIILKCLTWMGL